MGRPENKYAVIDIYTYKIANLISSFIISKHINLSPNIITLSQLPLLYLLYTKRKKNPALSSVLLIISSFLDNLDGEYARKSNKVTKLGSYLDLFMDGITGFVIILMFFKNYISKKIIFLITCLVIFQIDPKTHKSNRIILSIMHDFSFSLRIILSLLWYFDISKK